MTSGEPYRARHGERLAELAAAVWKGFACGAVSEEDAQRLAEEIAARKIVPPKPAEPRRRVGSRPRSPAEMERRRRWTSSGWLPPQLACRFTMAEAAVLSTIAAEVARRGLCRLTIGHIAALAGVCRRRCRTAVRQAVTLGILTSEEWRITAWRNAPNTVRIVSSEWRDLAQDARPEAGRGRPSAAGRGSVLEIPAGRPAPPWHPGRRGRVQILGAPLDYRFISNQNPPTNRTHPEWREKKERRMVEMTTDGTSLKTCLIPPVREVFDAARYLDAAVSAHLSGHSTMAAELIRLADMPEIATWTGSLWGLGGPWSRPLPVEHRILSIPKAERVPLRMPTSQEKAALIARDGRHCRFCGVPLVRAEVRKAMHRAYPEAARWGDRNVDQHTGLQALWLQFDHVLPHARGGTHDPDNLLVTCAPCNFGRSDLTLDEAGLADPRQRPPIVSTWDGLERFRP